MKQLFHGGVSKSLIHLHFLTLNCNIQQNLPFHIQHLNPQFIFLLFQNHHRSAIHLISSTNNDRVIVSQLTFRMIGIRMSMSIQAHIKRCFFQ